MESVVLTGGVLPGGRVGAVMGVVVLAAAVAAQCMMTIECLADPGQSLPADSVDEVSLVPPCADAAAEAGAEALVEVKSHHKTKYWRT